MNNSGLNVAGERYGRLIALERCGTGAHGKTLWKFKCDCGAEVVKKLANVKRGDTRSCGCLFKETVNRAAMKYRRPLGESSRDGLYVRYATSARKRHIEWKLEKEDFFKLVSLPCVYCGQPPSQSFRAHKLSNGDFVYTGVDRMDNNKGYIRGNCVPCCGVCNKSKATMDVIEFYRWIREVYERRPFK